VRDAAVPGPQDYQVFGLQVRSEFALPELLLSTASADPDVTISSGPVAVPATGAPGLHVQGGSLVLVVPGVARYRIEEGREIIVEPAPEVPERNIRLYLLGSVFGAILHQRGLLPLHANGVEIEGKAVAFMGPSGAGKSTLAAWFHDHGYRVIGDDVCVVRVGGDGRAFALPGLTRLRLWQDALEATGRQADGYERSYANDESWNKFDIPINRRVDGNRELALEALYLLKCSEEFAIRELGGLEAAEAIFANTYRGSYVAAAKTEQSHWQTSVRLVQSTPVYELSRTYDLGRMDDDCARIIEHAGARP
jgi:hypothetical protein